MNRHRLIAVIAARAGCVVEFALQPGTSPRALASELESFARTLDELARNLKNPVIDDGKLLSLQQELERRVGILTEFGPLRTTSNEAKTGPTANRELS